MKVLFILMLLSAYSFSWSQTNFEKGFKVGYKNGFCFDQYPCNSPEAPVAPVPGAYETASSYQHGYNRGFQQGLDENKIAATKYRTASVEPIDYAAKLNTRDTALYNAVLRQLKTRAQELIKTGGYKTAIGLCDAAFRTSPYDDELLRIGASAYLEVRNYDAALNYLKKAERMPTISPFTQAMIRSIKDGTIQKAHEQGKAFTPTW